MIQFIIGVNHFKKKSPQAWSRPPHSPKSPTNPAFLGCYRAEDAKCETHPRT